MNPGYYWCIRPNRAPDLCEVLLGEFEEEEPRQALCIRFLRGASFKYAEWRQNYAHPRTELVPVPDPAELAGMRYRLSERKTVHEWLNAKGVPDTETTGLRMCLLRRLSVALEIIPYSPGTPPGFSASPPGPPPQ